MAAHIVTALKQIEQQIESGKPDLHLDTALNLSCWTEDLDLDDYRSLGHLISDVDDPGLLPWVKIAIRKYTQVWEQVGEPSTREEWRDRYWDSSTWRGIRIVVDWEGNPWGKEEMNKALAVIPCTCQECVSARLAMEEDDHVSL